MRSKEAASGRFCRGKIIRQNSEIYLQEDKNMSLTVRLLLIATLLLSIVIPFGYFLIGQRTKKRYKRAIGTNVFFFFSTVLIAGIMLFAGDPEDSSALGKSLIFVGLAEGVCLYGLIISFMILGKL